eukprot:SAG22_NODE_9150_length_607_cov_1.007874_3_plen_38_part_01
MILSRQKQERAIKQKAARTTRESVGTYQRIIEDEQRAR